MPKVTRRGRNNKEPIAPRNAPVPMPNITAFTPAVAINDKPRSDEAKERKICKWAEDVANKWQLHAPTFRIAGVTLSKLMARKKNAKADKAIAQAIVDEMESIVPDAFSGRFEDEEGNILACVFAFAQASVQPVASLESQAQDKDEDFEGRNAPLYPGSVGRTLADLTGTGKPSKYDGIPRPLLKRYHQAAQALHACIAPLVNPRDIRHPNESIMTYEYSREGIENSSGLSKDLTTGYERTGVTHLVHAWHQQGHPNDPMSHSSDMAGRGNPEGQTAVRHYFNATREVALWLRQLFQTSFPAYFKKYEDAFKAGVWETSDPGPWLGRAIVWKLAVHLHQDGLDDGPTAIFNCGGYLGGHLHLPDLRVKLNYGPGDVIILMSGALYHSVSHWEPCSEGLADGLTPGRIGNVFFFPKASYDKLQDLEKRKNYHSHNGKNPAL